jgi:hypothetical protein
MPRHTKIPNWPGKCTSSASSGTTFPARTQMYIPSQPTKGFRSRSSRRGSPDKARGWLVYRRPFRFRTSASAADPCTSQSSTEPPPMADRSPGIAAIAPMKITSAELRTAGVGELRQRMARSSVSQARHRRASPSSCRQRGGSDLRMLRSTSRNNPLMGVRAWLASLEAQPRTPPLASLAADENLAVRVAAANAMAVWVCRV